MQLVVRVVEAVNNSDHASIRSLSVVGLGSARIVFRDGQILEAARPLRVLSILVSASVERPHWAKVGTSNKNMIRSRLFGDSMTTVDIGPMLAQAAERAPSWSPTRAIETLTRIHSCVEGSKIDWDSGAGEKWCRLLLKGSVLGAVSTLIPVVLLRSPVSPALQTVLDEAGASAGLILIPVSSWDAQSLSVEPQAALSAFARERWSDAVDPTCFSGSELWWMTV